MGFIEETGAAGLYRDARIAPIYEGTNGIQAIDLVTRKLPQGDGAHVFGYIDELAAIVDSAARVPISKGSAGQRTGSKGALDDLAQGHALPAEARPRKGGFANGACGRAPHISGSSRWRQGGVHAGARRTRIEKSAERIALCRFFAENLAGETRALRERVTDGAESLAAAAASLVTPDQWRGLNVTDHILIERRGAVQIIRMNRPDKKNAITRAMYTAMADAP